jgi:hypothetical protein
MKSLKRDIDVDEGKIKICSINGTKKKFFHLLIFSLLLFQTKGKLTLSAKFFLNRIVEKKKLFVNFHQRMN